MREHQCLLCRRTLVTATAYCQGGKEQLIQPTNQPNNFPIFPQQLSHQICTFLCMLSNLQHTRTNMKNWQASAAWGCYPRLEPALGVCYGNVAFALHRANTPFSYRPISFDSHKSTERAREHFYVNYVNLNSLATQDVRGAIQLSKLDGRGGREIKRRH